MGIVILGIDILGVDILGIDIPAATPYVVPLDYCEVLFNSMPIGYNHLTN